MASGGNDDEHADKDLISLVKRPSVLRKYFKDRPEFYEEVLQHIGTVLTNITQIELLITIELHLEERTRSHDPIDFRCCPRWTVFTVKNEICKIRPQYENSNLHVLYRRSIMKDWMLLKDCGVDRDGDVLFVYIHSLEGNPQLKPSVAIPTLPPVDVPMPAEQAISPQSLNLLNPHFKNQFPDVPMEGNMDLPITGDLSLQPPPNGAAMGKLWTCKSCTFLNEEWRNECCMCSTVRPTDDSAPLSMPVFDTSGPMMLNLEDMPRIVPIGWTCAQCTFINEPTRPGCEMCGLPRPADYKVPEDHIPSAREQERIDKEVAEMQAGAEQLSHERRENYIRHLSTVEQDIIHSTEPIDCMICYTETEPEDSIVLRECLHKFCKDCVTEHIKASEEATVTCPFSDGNYQCDNPITHREVKALLSEEDFKKFLDRGLMQAEKESENSFHCKTPDCNGWCLYEDNVNTFECPVCGCDNCLTCKAIHEGKNCKEYQEELERNAAIDEHAKKTKKLIEKMLKDGDAINCPQCNIIIQKKVGCDWIRCTMCKTEICWVTKGRRWGPGGYGDTSGGCRCMLNGKRCHKDCNNCH